MLTSRYQEVALLIPNARDLENDELVFLVKELELLQPAPDNANVITHLERGIRGRS